MNEILTTLWRTCIMLFACMLQAFGAIFKGIGIVFEYCSKVLRMFSAKLLEELDKGKSLEEIERNSKTEE